MTKHMLIDTTHAEETRVVVMDGDRVEDYDVETSSRKQLKGNIYLAKIIRVEPSLQAAFVEYGGNRHGFLAFSEIHPDYFQIPVADREKLLALQEEELAAEQRDFARSEDALLTDVSSDNDEEQEPPETVSGEHDTGEESAAARRTARFLKNYRIQEVIRRRQVMLVQIVKEERGSKGAALTTYISLAGRYCVLMPNALRGGGVSRKITSETDRRRLRDIVAELELPRSMAMIIRTAGAGRPEAEIIRDCEYLLQLWDDIRARALSSVAPVLVYEEANLIKRAIRDLFSRDIEDILIDGETAWKSAREFMRLLMPHNVGRVKLWQNRGHSLFAHHNVEGHLDAMFSPTVRLKSGGYLVINQTEALVSIDVNSGKSTSQRNIEETALRTNLEAAEEVARQLRLRDLAGLIVIDFIDMDTRRHNAQVEKRIKEALRFDRARIQVGHISHFGLLEMSRQRLRPSLAEAVLMPCPHCQGTGSVRGTESAALHVLRCIDETGARHRAAEINVQVAPSIALYLLNSKRASLTDIERRHQMQVTFQMEDSLSGAEVKIERLRTHTQNRPLPETKEHDADHHVPIVPAVRAIDIISGEAPARDEPAGPAESAAETEDHTPSRRRRRRGRRRNQGDSAEVPAMPEQKKPERDERGETELLAPGRKRTRLRRANVSYDDAPTASSDADQTARETKAAARPGYTGPTPANPFGGSFDIFDVIDRAEQQEQPRFPVEDASARTPDRDRSPEEASAPKRRRRTRSAKSRDDMGGADFEVPDAAPAPAVAEEPGVSAGSDAEKKPARRRRRSTKAEPAAAAEAAPSQSEAAPAPAPAKKPARKAATRKKSAKAEPADQAENAAVPQPINVDEAAPAKRRVGWWKR